MELKLDPPSGFADSYFDVEFIVKMNSHPKSVLSFFNTNANEHLDILGTVSGYISHGNQLVVKSKSQVQGHINIFNADKMNRKFDLYSSVTIKCQVDHYDDNNVLVESETNEVVFYNENQSLDAGVIPFDVIVHNNPVNIGNHEPLKLDVISGLAKKYELCIQSKDEKNRCYIEVSTKPGRTAIEIPAPMLYYDLGLQSNRNKRFFLYYVKLQGSNFARLANRKHIPLNVEIKFNIPDGLSPEPTMRLDPSGKTLPNNFMVSDRYLVICPKEYSGFATKLEFSREKMMDLTMLVNEGQSMDMLSNQMKQLSTSSSTNSNEAISNTNKKIERLRQGAVRPKISSDQFQLMRSVSGVYENIIAKTVVGSSKVESSRTVSALSTKIEHKKSEGCAPCARKKMKNAQNS